MTFKKLLPISIFVIIIFIFFWQFFLHGLLPIPSDTLVGLYNPFRDLYAQEFPRGVPFKNFLITDPIRQQYPWRELTISIEKQFQLPLWNPYSFSGYPLLANFQSGSLYPLNIIFFFLPFSLSWTALIIIQPLLAGVFLYLYLRNLKIHPIAAFLGGFAFAFSGFSVAWIEWGIILQTFLWVPLILLAKDKLLTHWTKKWMLIFLFAEITSFLAGHLQIWFYGLCVTNAYLFFRILQKTKRQQSKFFVAQYVKNYFPFFLVGLAMVFLTSVQWVPTLQFILLSARNVDQTALQPGWFIPWQHLVQFIVPDFFGNPTTLNYWGVWNYGELIGYVGIIPLFFAFFSIFGRHEKKTYFFSALCLTAFLFALPTPLGMLPYVLRIPFISTSQPTRLMGIIDLSLAVLSAFGMDVFLKKENTRKYIISTIALFLLFFALLWLLVSKFLSSTVSLENLSIVRHNMIFPTLLFASSILLISICIIFRKHISQKIRIILLIVLIGIAIVDQLRFAEKFTPFTPSTYLYPSSKALSFLQKNTGNYRIMTTSSQILPPNVSDIYRLQSIEGYDPLYIQTYGEFISAMQRNKPDISGPFGFHRIITPHTYQSPLINLLGVKYILSLDNINKQNYRMVFEEGQTKVYENNNVTPRVFFARSVWMTSEQDVINKLFDPSINLATTAILGFSFGMGMPYGESQYSDGDAHIVSYTPNKIVIKTKVDKNDGFLVLTDIYYPTWHVYVDGKEANILKTDFTFRGVFVPSGKHEVVFRDQLF